MNTSRRRQADSTRNLGAIEEHRSRKQLTSRNCTGRNPDAIPELPSPDDVDRRASNHKADHSVQSDDMPCEVSKQMGDRRSMRPTGGIALLIDILAREALNDVMASKGYKPRGRS